MNKNKLKKIWNSKYNADVKIMDILIEIYQLGYNDALTTNKVKETTI